MSGLEIVEAACVGDVFENGVAGDVVCVPFEATVGQTLELIAARRILSAPLLSEDKEHYHGLVDVHDLVAWCTLVGGDPKELKQKDAESLQTLGQQFQDERILEVVGIARLNPFLPVTKDTPLKDVCIEFSKVGTHRLPVVDETGRIINIISQSTVIRWIADNLGRLPHHLLVRPMAEMTAVLGRVLTVRNDKPALEAFRLITENRVSALAVVDHSGRLVGNISASDLRGIVGNKFGQLVLPVSKFIDANGHPPKTTLVTRPMDTLENVVLKMAVSKVHRVWIVDDTSRPVGICSMVDVFFELLKDLNP